MGRIEAGAPVAAWALHHPGEPMKSLYLLLLFACVACGPSERDASGSCEPGEMRECYTGEPATKDVGPCRGGMQQCTNAGQWGDCTGQVLPAAENCTDGIDNNCNGMIDERIDADGDGFPTCDAAGATIDCCDGYECGTPALVNPGAFEVADDGVDNDCDGTIDNVLPLCDAGLASNSSLATDYAKAIDICQMASATDRKWGLLDAKLSLLDGTGTPDPNSYSIRPRFGANVLPQGGSSVVLISSGGAAAKGDTNPPYRDFVSYQTTNSSPFPADFVAANGGTLPNAPGCPQAAGNVANDPVMLTLSVRVPTNARSFSLRSNFFSSEYPEYTCSPFNDFFVVLVDTMAADSPADKNLAFYSPPNSTAKVPVGVNLGHGNTGLFTQCVNGATGCAGGGATGTISTCTGMDDLSGTGFDDPSPGECDATSVKGGATGWLTTSGNVVPGEVITLRIAIWDTSDRQLDSLAVIDGFKWSVDPATPGTVILKTR
jgi:hypothetical protein